MPALPADLDVVIHSASTVSFDPPIDEAFATNVGARRGIYDALRASGADPHVVHVSTCYVGGVRKGVLPEASLDHDADWHVEWRPPPPPASGSSCAAGSPRCSAG